MEKEEETIKFDPKMEIPLYFRCPISMEVMLEPVTISTGVTYEKKNIEKWFYTYKKKTCPATMQSLNDFHLTPNHNLKRLILSWKERDSSKSSLLILPAVSVKHDELLSVLATIETTPFVVSSLKKLRSIVEISDETKLDFVQSGGIQVLSRMIVQILLDCGDFVVFRACEEALYILHLVPLLSDEKSMELLSKPECMKAMAIMLQRGSAEARLHTITIFRNMAKTEYNWSWVVLDQGMELFTSLFELVSDEINNKASSSALDVLIEILRASKKNLVKAIEAGAMLTLIDLLPDSNKSKCERMLLIIKLLCDCAEGRLALIDHSLGIVAISKKILRVSDLATRLGVKIIWSITTSHPLEKVLEEMLVYGSVRKLLGLLHIDGPSSTKDRALKIIKLHGNTWRKYPCFPSELRDYLVLKNDLN